MIKYYNTEAEYQADVKGGFESQVSLVGESNRVHYDGSSVVIGAKSATTGSIAALDGNSALHFIAEGTFNSSSFMSNWTVVGVVAVGVDHPDYRGQLLIVHKTNANKKWADCYSYRLTGYTLDGASRSGVLQLTATASGALTNYTINYSATTRKQLVSQLNDFFSANAGLAAQEFLAQEVGEEIHITLYLTASDQRDCKGSSGFVLTANLAPENIASSAMLRVNGQRPGEGSIISWPRALAYYRQDNGASAYMGGRTSVQTNLKQQYAINLPTWLGTSTKNPGDFCAPLRAVYGEGEVGWLKFMETMKAVYPTCYGSMGKPEQADGRALTYKLATRTYKKHDGNDYIAYPAAEYCASVKYNHKLLGYGNWFLPSIGDLLAIHKTIKYNASGATRSSDPINKALLAIGGSAISNGSLAWSSSRYYASLAWYLSGYYGFAYGGNVYSSNLAVPSVLLPVDEVND